MKKAWVRQFKYSVVRIYDRVFSSKIKTNFLQALPFWIASLLVGAVAVGYTRLFGLAEDYLCKITGLYSWAIFIMAPLCFLAAWLVVHLFAPTNPANCELYTFLRED